MGATHSPMLGSPVIPLRLVALDEGTDILLDRAMLVVGRHPQCDARLDSIRVSRRHCCMTYDRDTGELLVRDLGSTNGIRINGQRVEVGKMKAGDELSIAHVRYRLESGQSQEATLAETIPAHSKPFLAGHVPTGLPGEGENALAAAVRQVLPAGLENCQIQVIVKLPGDAAEIPDAEVATPESDEPSCQPDLSHSPPG